MSDSITAPTVGLDKLATDNGFEVLAVYLWERSGVDEPAVGDECDVLDEPVDAPPRPSAAVDECDIEVEEQEQGPARPSRRTSCGFPVVEEVEESVLSIDEKQRSSCVPRTSDLEPTGSEVETSEEKRTSNVDEKEPPQQTSGERLSKQETIPSVASGEKQRSSTAPRTSNLESSGSQAEVKPSEEKSTSNLAEKGSLQQTSGARLSKDVPSVASAEKQRSSTAPKTSDLEPSGSQADAQPPEQKSTSSMAEKGPPQQTSGARLSKEEGVPSVASGEKQRSSTAPRTSNLESFDSQQAGVEPTEQKSTSSVVEKGSKASQEPDVNQKSGEKQTSSQNDLADDTNQDNAN